MLIQRSTWIFCMLALAVSVFLFKVKYKVVEIEHDLSQTLAQLRREEENIHILKAEWTHLNEPNRLKELAKRHLDITPMMTEQILAITSPSVSPREKYEERPCSYTVPKDHGE